MKPTVLTVMVSIALAAPCAAAEGEIRLAVAPTLTLAPRGLGTNKGPGFALLGGYGVFHWLTVEGEVLCDRMVSAQARAPMGLSQYDSTRCAVLPSVALQMGHQVSLQVTAGAGYRYDRRSNRILSTNGEIISNRLADATLHQLIWRTSIGLEAQFFNHLSAAGRVTLIRPLLGETDHWDVVLGLLLSFYFFA